MVITTSSPVGKVFTLVRNCAARKTEIGQIVVVKEKFADVDKAAKVTLYVFDSDKDEAAKRCGELLILKSSGSEAFTDEMVTELDGLVEDAAQTLESLNMMSLSAIHKEWKLALGGQPEQAPDRSGCSEGG